jgi:hypothetical protein
VIPPPGVVSSEPAQYSPRPESLACAALGAGLGQPQIGRELVNVQYRENFQLRSIIVRLAHNAVDIIPLATERHTRDRCRTRHAEPPFNSRDLWVENELAKGPSARSWH